MNSFAGNRNEQILLKYVDKCEQKYGYAFMALLCKSFIN